MCQKDTRLLASKSFAIYFPNAARDKSRIFPTFSPEKFTLQPPKRKQQQTIFWWSNMMIQQKPPSSLLSSNSNMTLFPNNLALMCPHVKPGLAPAQGLGRQRVGWGSSPKRCDMWPSWWKKGNPGKDDPMEFYFVSGSGFFHNMIYLPLLTKHAWKRTLKARTQEQIWCKSKWNRLWSNSDTGRKEMQIGSAACMLVQKKPWAHISKTNQTTMNQYVCWKHIIFDIHNFKDLWITTQVYHARHP